MHIDHVGGTHGIRVANALALIMGLMVFATAGTSSAENPAEDGPFWISEDGSMRIYRSEDPDGRHLCPRLSGYRRQPFCRDFPASVLGACGGADGLLLVLADGSLHRVDSALIGRDGGFGPAHRPRLRLRLHSAWLPSPYCDAQAGFPEIVALADDGNMAVFDGNHWRRRPLSELPADSRPWGD